MLLGTPAVSLDLFSLSRRTGSSNLNTSSFFINNNNVCFQEVHGKGEYLQAIQVLAPRFRLFGTFFLENENTGGSAIGIHRDLLLEEAVVTHLFYVSKPRSYCPHTIWETTICDRQRPF